MIHPSFQPVDDLIKLLGIREFKLVLSPRAVILSAITLSYDRNLDSDEDLVQTLEDDSSSADPGSGSDCGSSG